MDRLRAQLVLILTLTLIVVCARERLERERENQMAGEIREKMAKLRDARQKMIAGISDEIDAVMNETAAAHADAIEALKLPRAELAAHRQEIADIRAEFAPLSNGGPAGPLPGDEKPSPPPSAASGLPPPSQGEQQTQPQQQPQASWGGGSGQG